MEVTEASFDDEGQLSPYLAQGDDGWEPAGEPRIVDYPDASYTYHMHHRAGRWADHGLFDPLTNTSVFFQSDVGRFLLDQRYADGLFYHDAELTQTDRASMAYGLAGVHGHAYAWVRWFKPGAAEDMGMVPEARLARFLGYDMDELTQVCREIAAALDDAWREDVSAYDFGDGVTYSLSELGALLRGSKGVYEMLYIFGRDEDREAAEEVFRRTARMLAALLESDDAIRDWGVSSQVEFTGDCVRPASDRVDTAELWDLVNHLTGGFTLVREQEETARFFTRLKPELLDDIGVFTDRMLKGALDHQMPDVYLVRELNFATGEVTDDAHAAVAIGRFITAAGNAYRQGSSFERAQDWDDVPAEVVDRSRALYDTMLSHTELLEAAFVGLGEQDRPDGQGRR